jgi:two-component system chemotaxis response regulator CheY
VEGDRVMKSIDILVVDDSLITIKKITKMIEDIGHKVVASARSGREAITQYQIFKPDIVTMDITMPEMNGIEALKRIIEKDSSAIVIMVTSHGQEQMVIDSIDLGAKGYLLKPLKEEQLKNHIEKAYEKYGDIK